MRERERQLDVPDCDVQVHQFCATGAVWHDVGEAVAMLKTLQRTIFERGPGRVLDPSTTCTRSVRLFLRSVAGSSEELESIERYCALGGTMFNSSTPERTHRACLAATTRRTITTLSSQGTVLRRLLRQLRRRNSQGLKAGARGFPREEDKETCRAGTPPRLHHAAQHQPRLYVQRHLKRST